jgi:hypothetical protein
MTDEILARPQIAGDGECIDTFVSIEDIGCGPFARGIFTRLGDLEKYSTGFRSVFEGKVGQKTKWMAYLLPGFHLVISEGARAM